jgi:hypothetical protein
MAKSEAVHIRLDEDQLQWLRDAAKFWNFGYSNEPATISEMIRDIIGQRISDSASESLNRIHLNANQYGKLVYIGESLAAQADEVDESDPICVLEWMIENWPVDD